MTARRAFCVLGLVTVLAGLAPGVAAAQGDPTAPPAGPVRPRAPRLEAPLRPGGPGGVRGADGLTAAQVEQRFDRYVLNQARTALQLGPGQLVPFGRQLQQLQAVRRRGQRERQRLLNDLNLASRGAEADDAALAEKVRALDDLASAVEQQVREAYGRLDEVLNVRQRARFRVFEQRMERQKLDLIARARQAARQSAAPSQP